MSHLHKRSSMFLLLQMSNDPSKWGEWMYLESPWWYLTLGAITAWGLNIVQTEVHVGTTMLGSMVQGYHSELALNASPPIHSACVCVSQSLVWNSGSAIGGDIYCFVHVSTDRDGDLPLTAATILLLWSAPQMQEPVDSWPTVAFTASQLLPHLTNIDCYTKQQRDVYLCGISNITMTSYWMTFSLGYH